MQILEYGTDVVFYVYANRNTFSHNINIAARKLELFGPHNMHIAESKLDLSGPHVTGIVPRFLYWKQKLDRCSPKKVQQEYVEFKHVNQRVSVISSIY